MNEILASHSTEKWLIFLCRFYAPTLINYLFFFNFFFFLKEILTKTEEFGESNSDNWERIFSRNFLN